MTPAVSRTHRVRWKRDRRLSSMLVTGDHEARNPMNQIYFNARAETVVAWRSKERRARVADRKSQRHPSPAWLCRRRARLGWSCNTTIQPRTENDMTTGKKMARRKLSLLQLAADLSNVGRPAG